MMRVGKWSLRENDGRCNENFRPEWLATGRARIPE